MQMQKQSALLNFERRSIIISKEKNSSFVSTEE